MVVLAPYVCCRAALRSLRRLWWACLCVLQGMADQACQPGATWQPFVITATFNPPAPPTIVAVSNYTWCATRRQQITAAEIVNAGVLRKTNTKLFRVDSSAGTQLMLLNAELQTSEGGQLNLLKTGVCIGRGGDPFVGPLLYFSGASVQNIVGGQTRVRHGQRDRHTRGGIFCVTGCHSMQLPPALNWGAQSSRCTGSASVPGP